MLLGKRDLANVMISRWEIILNDPDDPSVTIGSLKVDEEAEKREGDVKCDQKMQTVWFLT